MEQAVPFTVTADARFGPGFPGTRSRAVVLCVDAAYAPYALVTLNSLLANTADRSFEVVVLLHRVGADGVAPFRRIAEERACGLRLVGIASRELEALATPLWWTSSVYLRWVAPFVVPCPTLLYLDADLLVEGDVAELFGCKGEAGVVGGVEDRLAGLLRRQALGLPAGEPFLNTGVMLIDAAGWRGKKISERCLALARGFTGVFGVDQDVFNVVGAGEKYAIPERWNIQTFSHGSYDLGKTLSGFDRVGIVHFSGEVKPWMAWADPFGRRLYERYLGGVDVPPGFWREPRTVKERLLLAQVRDDAGDAAAANALRRAAIGALLAGAGADLLPRLDAAGGAPAPAERISDLLDREVVRAACPRLAPDPPLLSHAQEPHHLWDGLRRSGTIPLSRTNGNAYFPTRYADIRCIAEQPSVFSSAQIAVGPGVGATHLFPPFTSDPPIHAVHRGFLAPPFSPRNAETFRAAADRALDRALGGLAGRPSCELVWDFSIPYVVAAVGRLIGVEEGDLGAFGRDVAAWIRTDDGTGARGDAARAPIERRLKLLVRHRIAEPRDDVVSALAGVRQGGAPLDENFIAMLLVVLLLAGVETTAGVVSFAVRHLADGRNRAALGAPGFSWRRATEEFIRVASPAALARRSRTTASVGGCPIAADSPVLLSFAAANRDPAVFADPHAVKLDRARNVHIAFGIGPHQCLGMHLARVLVGAGVRRWVEAFPSYGIDGDGGIAWSPGPIRAISRLHVRLDGGAPAGGAAPR